MDSGNSDDVLNNVSDQYEFGDGGSSSLLPTETIDKPTSEWELKDISNIPFNSVDDAEYFYNQYAFDIGFSIRKDKIKVDYEVIRMRSWVCCRAGFYHAKQDKPGTKKTTTKRTRYRSRCGCMASFKVRLCIENNLYYPVEFNTAHNHDVVSPNYSHFLPSHRKIDEASAHQIAELRAAGIKPSQIMHVLVKSRGGYENVGFTRKDLFNHIYSTRELSESSHECALALEYLQGLARTDPGAYVRVDTDDDNRITRIFFADTISRSEYTTFGDVVMCDSTYKTNHLRLPLVLLVGVDNHCNTIVYACALLTAETKESYQWVYETFVACMGKAPGLIITDGDLAMRWAIREVLPTTRHRLCYWHIIRNLGGVCKNKRFQNELDVVMKKRFSEDVFWQKWNALLEKHGILKRNPRWVTEMTSTANLWAETFFEGVFSAGLFSNQRAESMNSSLKKHVDVTLTVAQFFHKYFVFLDCIRQGSMRQECINSQKVPGDLDIALFKSIRTQIATTYTLAVYEKLSRDINESEAFRCININLVSDAPTLHLRVYRYDNEDTTTNYFSLTCDRRDSSFECSCRMIETNGLPCKHIFASIKQLGLTNIADANLRRRWRKDARDMCQLSSSCSQSITGNGNRLAIIRPHCERLAYVASLGDEHMEIAMPVIQQLSHRLGDLAVVDENLRLSMATVTTISEFESTFGDPQVVRTKGAPSLRHASTIRTCRYCLSAGHSTPTCEQRKLDVAAGNIVNNRVRSKKTRMH